MSRISVPFVLKLILCISLFDTFRSEKVVNADNKLVTALIDHLSGLPGQTVKYEGGIITSAQKTLQDEIELDSIINVSCFENPCNLDTLKCRSRVVQDPTSGDWSVIDGSATCEPNAPKHSVGNVAPPSIIVDVPPSQDADTPLELDLPPEDFIYDDSQKAETPAIELAHEIQLNDQYVGSGEQFVAVRRDQGTWCADCPTDVNTDAEGVQNLANAAIQHLDRHRPGEKHNLRKILRVQRQAQVVNGVRYILLLEVDSISCVNQQENGCESESTTTNVCQVTFLEKPWLKLSNGSKFLAVMFNNCTEQYSFGDNGEEISTSDNNNKQKSSLENELDTNLNPGNSNNPTSNADDIVVAVQNLNLQAALPQNPVDEMDAGRLAALEEQIITDDVANEPQVQTLKAFPENSVKVVSVQTQEQGKPLTEENSQSITELNVQPQTDAAVEITNDATSVSPLSDDKKQVLDKFLNFYGFDPISSAPREQSPTKRNTDKYAIAWKDDNTLPVFVNQETQIVEKYNKPIEPFVNWKNIKHSSESDSHSSEEHRKIYKKIIKIDQNKHADVSSSSDESHSAVRKSTKRNNKSDSSSSEEDRAHSDILTINRINKPNSVNSYIRKSRSVFGQPVNKKEKVIHLANLAVNTLDQFDTDNANKRVLLEVLASKKEIGQFSAIYHMKLKIGISECQELDDNTRKCSLVSSRKVKICNVQVEVKPTGEEKVIKSFCSNYAPPERNNRAKRSMPGGVAVTPIDDPKIQELARASVVQYDLTSSTNNHHKIIEIKKATKQIVSGVLTKITFVLRESDCPKSSPYGDHCNALDSSPSKTCLSSIWDKSWLKSRVIEVNCDNENVRTKRDNKMDSFKWLEKYVSDHKNFDIFIAVHGRTYGDNKTEYRARFEIFRENLNIIDELNLNEQGTAKYGLTQFADLSRDEFSSKYLGLRKDLHNENFIQMPMAEIPNITDVPKQFDWRDSGAVTPVKNQGSCGSCWAFSVTGNIEGQWKIKSGNLLSLSEQELVDCDKLDEGCNGGLPDNAYRAIEQLGGLELETDYPYDAADEKCHYNTSLSRVQISGAVNISSNEIEMQKWLLQNGPISIGINANAMQFYMGGISHPLKFLCSPSNLDHGVLIVGYGVHTYPIFKKVMPFWIVKNSWGPSWGERGYYRVYRGDGTCGVNMMASSAVI